MEQIKDKLRVIAGNCPTFSLPGRANFSRKFDRAGLDLGCDQL